MHFRRNKSQSQNSVQNVWIFFVTLFFGPKMFEYIFMDLWDFFFLPEIHAPESFLTVRGSRTVLKLCKLFLGIFSLCFCLKNKESQKVSKSVEKSQKVSNLTVKYRKPFQSRYICCLSLTKENYYLYQSCTRVLKVLRFYLTQKAPLQSNKAVLRGGKTHLTLSEAWIFAR